MAESAVLEVAEDGVGTGTSGRLHKAVKEAGVKRKVSYCDGEVRCSTSINCERVKENSGLDETCHCCCSSHGSTDIDKEEASEFSDLEEETGDISASTYGLESCRERMRETMPLSDVIAESFDLKMTPELPADGNSSSSLFNNEAYNTTQELENLVPVVVGNDEVNSSRRPPKKAMIPPSNAELEDFFSATENDLMRQFTHRYNFDFVKEAPFEGRYEWVPVSSKP